MDSLDVEQFLEPVSPDQPCGENLEYDADFGELERAAQPVAAQQIGEAVVEGQEPDWKAVAGMATDLLQRTKDLRVAVLLTRAPADRGLAGFRHGLALVRGFVERYWDSVHPQLDPEDDHDPTLRVNTLVALCDHESCLRAVLTAPLMTSAVIWAGPYRDYLVTTGEIPPRADEQPREMSDFEGVFLNEDADALQQQAAVLQGAHEDVRAIEEAVTTAVGAGRSASFEPLESLLGKMHRLLQGYVEQRGLGATPEEVPAESEAVSDFGDLGLDAEAEAGGAEASPSFPPPASDEIRSSGRCDPHAG